MQEFHDKRFPGETQIYRAARNALLKEEIELRRKIESVAEFRRKLPLGGEIKEDYVFSEHVGELSEPVAEKQTRFGELFEQGKNTLIVYSFMFAPEQDAPCPMCNAILDGLNGNALHISQRMNLAVVAKAPVNKIKDWAYLREWKNLRLLSSEKNNYNRDYFAEIDNVGQIPSINVFVKNGNKVCHYYNTELLYAPSEPGQDPRHADMIWPLWNVFDLAPEGRGTGWMPKYEY